MLLERSLRSAATAIRLEFVAFILNIVERELLIERIIMQMQEPRDP